MELKKYQLMESWFSTMTSANARNNCTMCKNAKHVRSVNAKIKGPLLLLLLFVD